MVELTRGTSLPFRLIGVYLYTALLWPVVIWAPSQTPLWYQWTQIEVGEWILRLWRLKGGESHG